MEKTKEMYERKALCDSELELVATENIMRTLMNLAWGLRSKCRTCSL